jgi:hypothetical protein
MAVCGRAAAESGGGRARGRAPPPREAINQNVATKPPTTIKLGAGDHSDQGHRRGRGCVFSHNARAAADGSTAKALGLEVPHNLLVLADKVIE